jgi:methyl-accepting chemotaxis protein
MKISTKLTGLNVLITFALIAAITAVILIRAGKLQRQAALENITNLSASIANEIKIQSDACVQVLTAVAITTCYDESAPVEQRRPALQKALSLLVAVVPEFIGAYAVFPLNAFDGLDAFYANASTPGGGGGETGQLAFLATKKSGSLEFRTYDRYREALAGLSGTVMTTDPTLHMVNGRQKHLIDIGIPVAIGGKAPGLLAVQVGLEGIQTVADTVRPYDTGYIAVYSHGGIVAGHYEQANIGATFRNADGDMLGEEGVAAVEAALNGGSSKAFIRNNLIIGVHPFNTQGGANWALVSFAPLKTVLAPVYILLRFSIFFAIASVVIGAVIIFLASTRFTKHIVQVADAVKTIAQGDFTKRLSIHTHDEIGAMAGGFNETLQKVGGMIENIKSHSARLSEIGDELSTNMTKTAAAINEIAATIRGVTKQVDNQKSGVAQSGDATRKIIANIERLNQHIAAQSDSISQTSAAIEEMLANITSVTQTLVKNNENVTNLAHASDAGRGGLQAVSESILEIAKQSDGLLEITSVMNNIASQTNLLAMNAAIEAAHAGETGKGFAVVADEIRKLAESSGDQSKTIASVLKKIKESIDKIAASTDGVIKRFEAIDQNVKVVSEQEAEIRNAMEEQGSGSKQVLEHVGSLNELTGVIRKDLKDMLEESDEVIEASKSLENLTHEIMRGMNDTAAGAGEINTAVGRVSEISGENKRHIDILTSEISKFKTA